MSARCSLKKLLLVAVLLCALTTIMASTQNTCHIGNDDERQVARCDDDDSYLYLDVEHPASCAGIITGWRLCYYRPPPTDTEENTRQTEHKRLSRSPSDSRATSRSRSGSSLRTQQQYWATFAVYRKTDDGYMRVSTVTTFRSTRMLGTDVNNFTCYQDDSPDHGNPPLDVKVGDVLGACGTDDDKQLDIIGDSEVTTGQSLLQISNHYFDGKCKKNKIPSMVTINPGGQGLIQNVSRVLHLYANISTSTIASTTLVSVFTKVTNITSLPSVILSNIPSTVVPRSSAIQSEQSASKIVPSPTITSWITSMGMSLSVTTANQPDSSLSLTTGTAMDQSLMVTSIHKLPATVYSTIHQSSLVLSMMKPTPTLTATDVHRGDDSFNKLENLKLKTNESVSEINVTSAVYNLSSILNELENGQIVERIFSESVFSFVSNLLEITRRRFESQKYSPKDSIAGSTLLRVLENFAVHNNNVSSKSDNIVLLVDEVLVNGTSERISLIEDQHAGISIPKEVFSGAYRRQRVRIASLLLRNLSGLLPESLGEDNYSNANQHVSRLASPVISADVQCVNCTISNLSSPVEVTFMHLPYDMALLKNKNGSIKCVFWKFDHNLKEQQENETSQLLFSGKWSELGCETNFSLESTVCRCNHLTHFAILLSAQPIIDIPKPKVLALQITGYIGVSVSLVAMAATVFVFVFLKPLRTMRNYIHIQLCASLGISQIIFVAGVEPRFGEGQLLGGVPIGCQLVAVLLHYWFLVSFMWMLMEGVVLYVVLVRVFIKYHARYIVAFTISSYGLPLLYVGGLTVPLGFVRTDGYRKYHILGDYGYEQACYLNPKTSFIWSMLAPVILIFLANIGFFIMAIVIMYRHQKRQHTDNKMHKFKHWLKASISLTVIMGITWIIGFLVIEVEELFALAYIFTIFVACQGLFIFVIFVLLSKQVKETYAKWWKAKVAESDLLSKHFGDRSLTLGTILQPKVVHSNAASAQCRKANGQSMGSDLATKELIEFQSESHFSDSKPPAGVPMTYNCIRNDESMEEKDPTDSHVPALVHGFDNDCEDKF